MRISISNLAWERDDDVAVAELLHEARVDAVDLAPGKYFPDPSRADRSEIRAVRNFWESRGCEITGMQGLLFGSQGLNLFGSEAVQQQMLERLEAVCRIAAGLGARRLVFGAARHRDRSGLSDEAALEHATRFFRRFGAVASRYAQSVCVEPVPATAGSNFLLDSRSAEELVARVDHAALRLQFDTGALVASGEDPAEILARAADRIGHIHASEAGLGPLGSGRPDHAAIGALLRSSLPAHVVCVELLAGSAEARLEAIRRSLEVARRCYGDPPR